MWPCIVTSWYILIINQQDVLISQIYFRNKILHVSDRSSVHHQEFFTVHRTMVYVIQICWQLASRIRTELVPSWSCSQAVWHTPLLCVQWKTADDGQRNCPKHVEFYSKIRFEKLVHLVCFIIRIFTMHGHLNVKIVYLFYLVFGLIGWISYLLCCHTVCLFIV